MKNTWIIAAFVFAISANAQSQRFYKEKYRPQFHFTPAIHWTNDPNGLVYHNGEYHLFYQFNPFGTRWGHMSWGHAISRDLAHWEHLPLAIGEEKDTMIYSGSCVVDSSNSTGFAERPGQSPMVAIYTADVKFNSESQHIAYSLDNGRNWKKYNHNPVLDIQKKDFRDPHVFWFSKEKKWVMTVAWPIERQMQFYSSKDLKDWKLTGSFGPEGDTSGIWECPALFEVPVANKPGESKWVLMHSPSPYMQYFVGEFDGMVFKNENDSHKTYRPDYGPDYYAAIAYNNLPAKVDPVSIGWVNNWNYANDIPTTPWKSAMSLPRSLSIKKINDEWILLQQPVESLKSLRGKLSAYKNITINNRYTLPVKSQCMELILEWQPPKSGKSGIQLAKGRDQYFEIGYDPVSKELYIDRSKSGDYSFHPSFPKLAVYKSQVKLVNGKLLLHIFFDKSIIEIFANEGEVVMTAQLFPGEKNNGIEIFGSGTFKFENVNVWEMKSIWAD